MTHDQTITTDVELALAQLETEVHRLVDLLADTRLQLADVRAERDQEHQLAEQEHQLAEATRAQLDKEHRYAESLKAALANSAAIQESLNAAFAKNAAIAAACGVVSEKAGVSIDEAQAEIKRFSRGHGEPMRAVAARIIAAQDPKSPSYGDSEVARIIANVGVPQEFWNALTLNGAIFE